MRSFDRKYRLDIGDVEITGLDVEFDIKKTLKKEPNTAAIRIFNLAEKTRRAFEGRDLPVAIHAGYASDSPLGASTESALTDIGLGPGSTLPLLFSGTLRYAHSTQTPEQDWLTSISSGDGDRGVTKARTKRSYRAGTPWIEIIEDLCDDLGIGTGNILELNSSIDLATKKLGKKKIVHGSAADELSKILDSSGYDWSIQDGDLQMLSFGSPTSDEAVILDKDSGLIGSPEIALRTDARKSGKVPKVELKQPNHFIKARSLLNANLTPGRLVKISAVMITGYYRVESVMHFGQIAESMWYSDIEATELTI